MKKQYTKPFAELINFDAREAVMNDDFVMNGDIDLDGPGFGEMSVPDEW